MKKLYIQFILPFIIYSSLWSQTKTANLDSLIECPAILESAFISGTKANEGKFNYIFTVVTLGEINIKSGKIIAMSPMLLSQGEAFVQKFPKGNFKVELSIANDSVSKRVAYSRIKFSNRKVTRWELALHKGQKQKSIYDTAVYCYSVDDATGLFMDIESKTCCGLYERYNIDQMVSKFNEGHWYGFIEQNGKYNAAYFTTGEGAGCYATYIGYDASGKICRLLTDFGFISWWEKKP